jgi:hypothetical protein
MADVGEGAAPFGFKGAGFDLAVGVEEAKRNALRRFYGSGDLHFVTFSCYRRSEDRIR